MHAREGVWGEATAFLERFRRIGWFDFVLLAAFIGLVFGLFSLAGEWRTPRPAVHIDLSPSALPVYAFYSLSRGLLAYALSLLFTLVYGYWAAKDPIAERVLVPLLDILQSIPVLGFMPGLVLALVALFPRSNVGLELAAVLMIFTGQAWNMTFSFYHSLRSVPRTSCEAATRLPLRLVGAAALGRAAVLHHRPGLEQHDEHGRRLVLPDDHRGVRPRRQGLPPARHRLVHERGRGAGRRAGHALGHGGHGADDRRARPAAVAAGRGLGAEVPRRGGRPASRSSRRGSTTGCAARSLVRVARRNRATASSRASLVRARGHREEPRPRGAAALVAGLLSLAVFVLLVAASAVRRLAARSRSSGSSRGASCLPILRGRRPATLGRVLLSTALGTLWALPAGLAIGLSPRLSRIVQPVVQVVASFPAPMLFPLVIAAAAGRRRRRSTGAASC